MGRPKKQLIFSKVILTSEEDEIMSTIMKTSKDCRARFVYRYMYDQKSRVKMSVNFININIFII